MPAAIARPGGPSHRRPDAAGKEKSQTSKGRFRRGHPAEQNQRSLPPRQLDEPVRNYFSREQRDRQSERQRDAGGRADHAALSLHREDSCVQLAQFGGSALFGAVVFRCLRDKSSRQSIGTHEDWNRILRCAPRQMGGWRAPRHANARAKGALQRGSRATQDGRFTRASHGAAERAIHLVFNPQQRARQISQNPCHPDAKVLFDRRSRCSDSRHHQFRRKRFLLGVFCLVHAAIGSLRPDMEAPSREACRFPKRPRFPFRPEILCRTRRAP